MWSDRRRLLGLLAVSLLLNVFLGGVMVGRGFAVHRARPPARAEGPLVPNRRVVSLPEDQKAMFHAAMIAHRPELRAAHRAHLEAREKIEADIAAPVFDRAAVAADFDALHETNRRVDAAVGAALLDALSGLDAPSRAALVSHDGDAAGPGKPP